jgi:hypothetical protein
MRAVAAHSPRIIGLVDGAFETTPAVWHKELMWAMAQGVRVLGAASMGALRAAEMADHGMVGVGEIFAAYRSGRIEDDDEVAVLHGPAATGYEPTSEALVNIRATLERAEDEGIVDPTTRDGLLHLAKARFYAERTFDALLADARRGDVDPRLLDDLQDWLPHGRLNVKRSDALLLLQRTVDEVRAGPREGDPDVRPFEHTWISADALALSTQDVNDGSAVGGSSDGLIGRIARIGRVTSGTTSKRRSWRRRRGPR